MHAQDLDALISNPGSPALPGELATSVLRLFCDVRGATEALCAPLGPEDYLVQSMPEASPAKWHLAHTSWFFEAFLLSRNLAGYRPFRPEFNFLFNSYYDAVGPRLARASRGLITRPTVAEVFTYRRHVDARVEDLLRDLDESRLAELVPVVLLGLHHEQQHQELLLTDLKHAFAQNPLRPAYLSSPRPAEAESSSPFSWAGFPEGVRWIGYHGLGFSYDNERPRHRVFLEAFQLATRPATNAEYLGFIEDNGYQRPELWLSDGWALAQKEGWQAPLYWERSRAGWQTFTLGGNQPVSPAEPVCHLSYYEADAFARWAHARLPTEAEWEVAGDHLEIDGNFVESGRLHPAPAAGSPNELAQVFGDTWEWTASPYTPYPGFTPEAGALGEYNAKFMANQWVLRGGSCVSPHCHLRATYRNYWPPHARWQFSGVRLARNA